MAKRKTGATAAQIKEQKERLELAYQILRAHQKSQRERSKRRK